MIVAPFDKIVDLGPRFGHVSAMAKTATPNDPYNAKRHKWYAEAWIADGLDALAKTNKEQGRKGQTRSQILEIAAKKLLRLNASRLRKAGHQLPDDLFAK